MAKLPKIDSEGLRLAKADGAKRVSSVLRVRKNPDDGLAAIHDPRFQWREVPLDEV